jgi:hypothetical protein
MKNQPGECTSFEYRSKYAVTQSEHRFGSALNSVRRYAMLAPEMEALSQ